MLKNKSRKTDYPFMDEITPYWQEKIRNGEVSRTATKIEFICHKNEQHNHYFQTIYNRERLVYPCPECLKEHRILDQVKTHYPFWDEITPEFQEKIKNKEIRSKDQVEFICQKPENPHSNYMQTLSDHVGGAGCFECAKEARREKRIYRDYPFMDEITPEWQEKIRNGECNAFTKVEFICQKPERNHLNYMQQLTCHNNANQGCPQCAVMDKRNHDYSFINDITPEYREKIRNGEIGIKDVVDFNCEKHGVYQQLIESHMKGRGCHRCFQEQTASTYEKELAHILEEKTTVILNDRQTIAPYEIDILLPDLKIGVEYNGIYWHSTKHNDDKNYHAKKYFMALEQGIHLIQIWETEYIENPERVVNMILSHCNLLQRVSVGARDCVVKLISNEDKKDFLNTYHIQGNDKSIGYGLFYHDSLVSLIGIRKQPSNTSVKEGNTYILSRYCTKDSIYVNGGLQKLLRFAEKDKSIDKWVSFGDLRFVNKDSNMYLADNWVEDDILPPDYQYVCGKQLVHKFNFRLKRFREDPNLLYFDGLSEYDLSILNDIPRVYDCGKVRYIKYVG